MNDLITNGVEIKQRILNEINNATSCIYVAMAYFTDRDIALAIVEGKKRGLIVDIILSSNAQNETVKLILKGAGVSVHAFETGDSRGIMHHKFCLIDNKISINGSYNYSINASNNNVENIQVSDDTATYSQFMAEFERLKYNIDHNIGVNEITAVPETKMPPIQPVVNIIDTFSQHLHNLVYSAAQIDTEKYRISGYETSKESQGNIDIFRTEYHTIKERIRTYATDEGLNSKKNILYSNISIAYESAKTNLETEKEEKIAIEKRNYELARRQTEDKISAFKEAKSTLESGNQNTGEKGLLQINKDIEKNKLERRNLEQSFIVSKFWKVGTILASVGLCIFVFYLSIFFASAIYKVFFEGDIIKQIREEGGSIPSSKLVDANAIIYIFKREGSLFGLISALFFLIPVLLSNLKILGNENKKVNNLLFIVGLVIFDIVVAIMVAFNTDEIKNLKNGIGKSTMQLWDVVKLGEFWLIFVFGMFPLILVHYLIDYLIKDYNKSKREIVDAEKNRKIQFLDEEMIELDSDKESVSSKIQQKVEEINLLTTKILNLETEINNLENQISTKYNELQKQIKAIFDDFSARITSGRIFTDVILDSVISAYKSGFIEYLPNYYSSEEVAIRVKEIEQTTKI